MNKELVELRVKAETEKDWDKKRGFREEVAHIETMELMKAEEEAKAAGLALAGAMKERPGFGLLMAGVDKLASVGRIVGSNVLPHLIWATAIVVTTYIIAVSHYIVIK